MKGSLINKFIKFSYGNWVGLVLGLITTMIVTRILPPNAFGKVSMYDLILQIGLIITIFGTDQSFIRFFYEEHSENRGALLYNCLRLPLITTAIMVAVIILLNEPISRFVIGEANFKFSVILVIGIVFQLVFRFGQLVIRMQQKASLYSMLQIYNSLFNLIFVIILYYLLGSDFKVMIYAKVITMILLTFIAIYFGRNILKISNRVVKNVKHSQLEIIKYGSPFVLTIFITWLFQSFDKIALRQWSDFEELGLYAAAMRLVALVMVLRTSFST